MMGTSAGASAVAPSALAAIELTKLAKRVEEAAGLPLHLRKVEFAALNRAIREAMLVPASRHMADFCRSLDASMTLIDPAWSWTLEPDTAWVRWMGKEDVEEAQCGFSGGGGTCTVLALTAAALLAHAALLGSDSQSETNDGD